MDGGMLEEAVGAKWICKLVLQHFWKGSVYNYQHPYHDKVTTEVVNMGVLDAAETLILPKTVLQEPVLMVRTWIQMLATVVDVAVTLPMIVTQEHTSMAILCER